MTPQAIIVSATKDGLYLSAAKDGNLRYKGKQDVVTRWLPMLKAHKPEILAALKAANDTASRFDAEAITEAHEERAAILEYDGGLLRQESEHRAWRILLRDGTVLTSCYDPPKTRAQVLDALVNVADLEPVVPPTSPTGELSRQDESDLRAWLALIGETDEAMIYTVLEQCAADDDTRRYYLNPARD